MLPLAPAYVTKQLETAQVPARISIQTPVVAAVRKALAQIQLYQSLTQILVLAHAT